MSDRSTTTRIGKKLRELRKAYNYTQSEVAMAADIKQQTYSAYESGQRTPGSVPLYKIASYYGIPADDLMKLCINLDENLYFDETPLSDLGISTADFLNFYNDPKYASLSHQQKEILYHMSKLDACDRKELIEYAVFKVSRKQAITNS